MAVARERVHYDRFSILIVPSGYQALRSYPVKEGSVVRFEITIAARQIDEANRATFKRIGLFYREGSSNLQHQGKLWHTMDTIKSDDNMDIKYNLSADRINIQVRNASNVPTRWSGYVDIISIKS